MLLTRLAYRPLLQRGSRLLVGQCILRWPVLIGMGLLPLLAAVGGRTGFRWPCRHWPGRLDA
jgi:hypothetical protein